MTVPLSALAQAFQNFDGRGFPGTVGSKQAKDFAGLDFKSDSAQGLEVAITLAQTFHTHDRGVGVILHDVKSS